MSAEITTSRKLSSEENFARFCKLIAFDFRNLKNIEASEQTPDLVDFALEQSYEAIRYVKNPTEDQILKAVKIDGCALQHIHSKRQTEKICLAAIEAGSKIGVPFYSVKKKTPSICKAALLKASQFTAYEIFSRVPIKTYELCLIAVRKSNVDLRFYPNELIDDDMYLAALENSISNAKYISGDFSVEFYTRVMDFDPDTIRFINPSLVNSSLLYTKENCLKAVKHNWLNLDFIPHDKLSEEIVMTAYDQNILALRFIWPDVEYQISRQFDGIRDDKKIHVVSTSTDTAEFKHIQSLDRVRQIECALNKSKQEFVSISSPTLKTQKLDIL